MKKLKTSNKIKKFDEVMKFDEEQLKIVTQYRADFLKKIYPFLNENEFNDGCIELRVLARLSEVDKKNEEIKKEYTYIRSYNAWHMDQKDIENLYKFGQLINGKQYCLYYSVYAFDYNKKVINKSKSTKDNIVYRHFWEINEENALFTTILGADFDNITINEFNKYKQILLNIGLQTIDIHTGHGVQSIVLLDRKYYDPELLRKFAFVLQQKGFPIDESVKNASRVLRLPYSFNCKEFSKDTDKAQAINTFVLADTDKRYSIIEVFQALNTLPDIIPPSKGLENQAELIKNLESTESKPIKIEKPNLKKEYTQIEFKNIAGEYQLDFERLSPSIRKMLSGTPEGLRNATMLFLIPFFKNAMKLSKEHITEIMKVWDKHCLPSQGEHQIVAEVKRLWVYNFEKKFGAYPAELQDYYGEITFNEYKLDNTILIPNLFFKHLQGITDAAVQIYLSMLLSNKLENKKALTAKEIIECASISKMTFYRNINMLILCGFIDKKRSCKKAGEEHSYRVNAYKYLIGDRGYTKIEVSTVKLMLKELTKGEISLYIYLRYMISSTQNSKCYATQEYIATQLGKKRAAISVNTSALHDKKYIKKETIKQGIVSHSTYTLIY